MGDVDNTRKYYNELLEAAEPEYAELRKVRQENNKKALDEEVKKEYLAKIEGAAGKLKPNALRKRRSRK